MCWAVMGKYNYLLHQTGNTAQNSGPLALNYFMDSSNSITSDAHTFYNWLIRQKLAAYKPNLMCINLRARSP